MFTKEKQPKIKQLNNVDTEVDINAINEIYRKRWKILIFSIIFIFVILTLIVIYILKLYNMSIYNPYETKIINITSEAKDWYANENINLFKHINKDGEKVIWPGQSGEYDFVVKNTNNVPIYYSIKLSEENKSKINMKYRLKLNNVYIVGNENTYEPIEKFNLENIKILEDAKSSYTLEWKWEDSDNDAEIVKRGLATYRIYIDINSKTIGENILDI